MISTILSRKGVILIVIPAFAIFLQYFLRFALEKDFNTIGITFGALGVGQLLPFSYFDHFVANKVLGIKPSYTYPSNKLTITYDLSANVAPEKIEGLKNLFHVATFINLGLFLVIVYCGIVGRVCLHIFFGILSCTITWYLILFKK